MNKIEKSQERLIRYIPNEFAYFIAIFSSLVIALDKIKGAKEGIRSILETNFKQLIPVVQVVVYLSYLGVPALVCYLIYLMIDFKKKHDSLLRYTQAEIKRLDDFKELLVIHHQNHEGVDLYLQGMIYYCYADFLDPKEDKAEIKLCNKKAVASLISALLFIGNHKNVVNLKEVLSRLSIFILSLSKKELEEVSITFNFDLLLILSQIESNDSTMAVTAEVKNLRHILSTM